jgi:hypothetical protein
MGGSTPEPVRFDLQITEALDQGPIDQDNVSATNLAGTRNLTSRFRNRRFQVGTGKCSHLKVGC